MGSCCSESESYSTHKDEYTLVERMLNLHLIRFNEFSQILLPLCDQEAVSIQDLRRAFKGHLMASDLNCHSTLKTMLDFSFFQSQNRFNPLKLMSLGLMYTSGTPLEKAEGVIKVYDKNSDGQIFVNSVRRLLRDVFLISAFLVPALLRREEYVEGREEDEIQISQWVVDSVSKIFHDELRISSTKLKDALAGNMRFLFHSSEVRQLFNNAQ